MGRLRRWCGHRNSRFITVSIINGCSTSIVAAGRWQQTPVRAARNGSGRFERTALGRSRRAARAPVQHETGRRRRAPERPTEAAAPLYAVAPQRTERSHERTPCGPVRAGVARGGREAVYSGDIRNTFWRCEPTSRLPTILAVGGRKRVIGRLTMMRWQNREGTF
jgi:hypothetical protein